MCRRLGNDGSDYFNDYSERYFVVIAIAVVVVVAVVVVTAVYALGLPQCLPATIAMEREREGERECMNTRLAHRRVPLIALTITGVAKSENIYCLRLHSVSVR